MAASTAARKSSAGRHVLDAEIIAAFALMARATNLSFIESGPGFIGGWAASGMFSLTTSEKGSGHVGRKDLVVTSVDYVTGIEALSQATDAV